VPAAATCTLNGTSVQGSITVEPGAILDAAAIDVVGNIQGEGATAVYVVSERHDDDLARIATSDQLSASVGGSIHVKRSGAATIHAVAVGGDVRLEANSGLQVAENNKTNGNLVAVNNAGAVRITGNVIAGNLQCSANSATVRGGGNAVSGRVEDQCAQLDAVHLFLSALAR
jgi:hypothetical protein